MKKIYRLLTLLMLLPIVSCDNFLDINPDAEVVNDDMFKDRQGCEDAIMGIYGKLKMDALYGEFYNWGVFDLLSQDLSCSYQVQPNYNFVIYDYNAGKNMIQEMWQYPYEVIGYINNAITNLESKAENAFPLINTYKGELYALRAMLHFDVVKAFAKHVERAGNEQGIPYVTTYSFKHTPFSTVSEVYEKIVADLKKAQTLLVDDVENMNYPRLDDEIKLNFLKYRQTHMNYYAATAVLARVLRMQGKYDDAKAEALKVIDSKKFPLASKDEIVDLVAGVLSPKETIFGVYSTSYIKTTQNRLYYQQSWSAYSLYQTISGGQFLFNYETVYGRDLGENAGQDARLQWIRSLKEGGTSVNLLKNVDVTLIEQSSNTPSSRKLIDGISLIRIPEMYYIVAEALIRNEQMDEAADYLNPVLLSRGLTKLEDRNPALKPNLELLYNERYKELYGEGQRWFDMKKLHLDIDSNEEMKVIPASDDIYVFPIPQEEFEYRTEK